MNKLDKDWCMCTELDEVYRDCYSTCSICGGKDAYGKSANRPIEKQKLVKGVTNQKDKKWAGWQDIVRFYN